MKEKILFRLLRPLIASRLPNLMRAGATAFGAWLAANGAADIHLHDGNATLSVLESILGLTLIGLSWIASFLDKKDFLGSAVLGELVVGPRVRNGIEVLYQKLIAITSGVWVAIGASPNDELASFLTALAMWIGAQVWDYFSNRERALDQHNGGFFGRFFG